MTKKIEDRDFYELLNLTLDATRTEIENAYLFAIATYDRESLASYRIISEEEREAILERIEEAFQTLINPKKKKDYDSWLRPHRPEYRQKAYFRRSMERMLIEDAAEADETWEKAESAGHPCQDQENGRESRVPLYGELLKKVRKRKGISLEQIAREHKLGLTLLQALEEDEYAVLPEGKDLDRLRRAYAKSLGFRSFDGQEDDPAGSGELDDHLKAH